MSITNYKLYRKAKGGVWYRRTKSEWVQARDEAHARQELEMLRALSPFGFEEVPNTIEKHK